MNTKGRAGERQEPEAANEGRVSEFQQPGFFTADDPSRPPWDPPYPLPR
jgi:hypothetical protein